MDTAPPPPPPPPPPSLLLPGNLAQKTHDNPRPQHAAIPFTEYTPTQEASPSPEALQDAQGEENPPPSPLSMPSEEQEDDDSDRKEKYHPVQETNPAPQALQGTQMMEQQDEEATHMEPAGESQQA